MTTADNPTDKPGDPADRGVPEDNFGNVQTHATHSHRAGYGDDKLARLVAWLRAHPTTTLASGEGALLLAEIDRLRDDLHTQDGWVQWAKGEINALRRANKDSLDHYTDARNEIDRLRRILAALREPSEQVVNAVHKTRVRVSCNCLFVHVAPVSAAVLVSAAVAAAEREVGRE